MMSVKSGSFVVSSKHPSYLCLICFLNINEFKVQSCFWQANVYLLIKNAEFHMSWLSENIKFMQNAYNDGFYLCKYREIIWEPLAHLSPDPLERTYTTHGHTTHRIVAWQIGQSLYALQSLFNITKTNPWTPTLTLCTVCLLTVIQNHWYNQSVALLLYQKGTW
jgi:hypothetical protein